MLSPGPSVVGTAEACSPSNRWEWQSGGKSPNEQGMKTWLWELVGRDGSGELGLSPATSTRNRLYIQVEAQQGFQSHVTGATAIGKHGVRRDHGI
jgi:hypothetical protein